MISYRRSRDGAGDRARDAAWEEHLLALLCECSRRRDPAPDEVLAAARSTFHVRTVDNTIGEPEMSTQTEGPAGSAGDAQEQVQSPLTLVMPLVSQQAADGLRAKLAQPGGMQQAIDDALNSLGTVHFARFVMLDGDPPKLAVITSFDDTFDDYIISFTKRLGPIFDTILQFVVDPPPTPVIDHGREFVEWVGAHDLGCLGSFYSAYPQKRVRDIVGASAS